MGDWLINYQGGMVRRGLLGEIIFQLSKLTTISPGLIVLFTQTFAYFVFFNFSYRLLKKQKSLLPYTLLILSPFIFTFQINDIAGGFRKEIIFFAILSFAAWCSVHQSISKFEKTFYVVLFAYPLAILSHEQLGILLPYLLLVYLHKIKLSRKRIIIVLALSLLSVIAFIVCIYYPGTESHAESIHYSLKSLNYEVQSGAIQALGTSLTDNTISAQSTIIQHKYFLYYPPIFLLSLIAYIPICGNILELTKISFFYILIAISLVGTAILLSVTHDWGRLIYIHLVSIFILSLLVENNSSNYIHHFSKMLCSSNKVALKSAKGYLVIILLCIYSLTWYIPHIKPEQMFSLYSYTTIGRIIFPYKAVNQLRTK